MRERRRFLELVAAAGAAFGGPALAQARRAEAAPVIARAADALDIFDLEAVAQRNLPLDRWGYLISGVDGDDTCAPTGRPTTATSCALAGWST